MIRLVVMFVSGLGIGALAIQFGERPLATAMLQASLTDPYLDISGANVRIWMTTNRIDCDIGDNYVQSVQIGAISMPNMFISPYVSTIAEDQP